MVMSGFSPLSTGYARQKSDARDRIGRTLRIASTREVIGSNVILAASEARSLHVHDRPSAVSSPFPWKGLAIGPVLAPMCAESPLRLAAYPTRWPGVFSFACHKNPSSKPPRALPGGRSGFIFPRAGQLIDLCLQQPVTARTAQARDGPAAVHPCRRASRCTVQKSRRSTCCSYPPGSRSWPPGWAPPAVRRDSDATGPVLMVTESLREMGEKRASRGFPSHARSADQVASQDRSNPAQLGTLL
jgi:hypothetical protein